MLHQVPFLGFVIFYIIGVVAGHSVVSTDMQLQWYLLVTTFLVGVTLYFVYKKRNKNLSGVFVNILLLIAGFCQSVFTNVGLTAVQSMAQQPHDFYELTISSLPESRQQNLRFLGEITRIHSNIGWHSLKGAMLFTIPGDAAYVPSPGDHILVKGTLKIPIPPLNPGEFDYRQYLWDGRITMSGFAEDGRFVKIDAPRESFEWKFVPMHASAWADRIFRAYIMDDRAYALIKAVILGRRDDLRTEQVEDFKVAGAVHILSVSGLHVGIIFLILGKLFGWVKRNVYGKILYALLVTFILCFYAMITGLPASVIRATIMCLIFLISEISGRDHQPMNTLAISAFILILFDPFAVFNIGFQLTYLAMAGIFMFYDKLNRLFVIQNRFLRYLWNVTALALAAQITTFPVIIYTFHQFPTYFWLFNPLVVFLIDIALNASLILLVLSVLPWGWPAVMAAKVAEYCGILTNLSASLTHFLPFNLIENLTINSIEMVMFYGLIMVTWLAWHFQDFRYLKILAAGAFGYAVCSISIDTQRYLTEEAYAFSVPRHTVIGIKKGNTLYLLADHTFKKDSGVYKFHIYNYAVGAGVLKTIVLNGSQKDIPHIEMTRSKMAIWGDKVFYIGPLAKDLRGVDYALITEGFNPDRLGSAGETKILLGGTISKRKRDKIISAPIFRAAKVTDLSKGFFRF